MNLFRIISLCVALTLSLPIFAASAKITIGETSIEVPSYKDLNNANPDAPRMVEYMASIPRSNFKFYALFLPKNVIVESKKLNALVYAGNYAIFTVKSDTFNSKYSISDFERIKKTIASQASKVDNSNAPSEINNSSVSKNNNVEIRKFVIGSIISQSPYHISIPTNMDVKNTNDKSTFTSFSVMSYVLVKNKVLNIQTVYIDPTRMDVANAASDAAAWAKAIVTLNGG